MVKVYERKERIDGEMLSEIHGLVYYSFYFISFDFTRSFVNPVGSVVLLLPNNSLTTRPK
jgi:hypothetical protein